MLDGLEAYAQDTGITILSREAGVTLLLILVLTTIALFALFWGGSLIAQGYLYNAPAEHLPYRALGAAVLVAVFLSFWVWLDRKNPGRYGTFFEFSPYEMQEFDEFEAVRWQAAPGSLSRGKTPELAKGPDGKPTETVVKVHRLAGNKTAPFLAAGGKAFHLQEGGTMTGAISVKLPDAPAPVRFNADLKQDPRMGPVYATDEKRFSEPNGSRYVLGTQLGVVYIPSTGAILFALFVNLLHFVIWLVAIWLVLRFAFGHALGFAFVCGLVTMLLVMPLLFKPHRTAQVTELRTSRPTAELAVRRTPLAVTTGQSIN